MGSDRAWDGRAGKLADLMDLPPRTILQLNTSARDPNSVIAPVDYSDRHGVDHVAVRHTEQSSRRCDLDPILSRESP